MSTKTKEQRAAARRLERLLARANRQLEAPGAEPAVVRAYRQLVLDLDAIADQRDEVTR